MFFVLYIQNRPSSLCKNYARFCLSGVKNCTYKKIIYKRIYSFRAYATTYGKGLYV